MDTPRRETTLSRLDALSRAPTSADLRQTVARSTGVALDPPAPPETASHSHGDAEGPAAYQLPPPRNKPRILFGTKQAVAVMLVLTAALGLSLSLLVQQSVNLSRVAAQPRASAPTLSQAPKQTADTPAPETTGSQETPQPPSPTEHSTGTPSIPSTQPSTQINLNTATAQELESIKGIGPVTARRILEHRTAIGRFANVDQLLDVKGIGPKTLDKLRPMVTAG